MPTTLTAADFLSLRMQYKAEQAENEIPAVIEHNFKDGRMVDHYFVVPGPALLADEAVQDFGGKIENILFLQQSEPGAPWQVLLHEPSMIREITFEMPEEEFRAMLAKNNLILPGDPGGISTDALIQLADTGLPVQHRIHFLHLLCILCFRIFFSCSYL